MVPEDQRLAQKAVVHLNCHVDEATTAEYEVDDVDHLICLPLCPLL
jgi:hypothetical protein